METSCPSPSIHLPSFYGSRTAQSFYFIFIFIFVFLSVPGIEPGEAEPRLDDEPDREPARRVQRSPQTLHGTLLCYTAVVQRYAYGTHTYGTKRYKKGRHNMAQRGTIWFDTQYGAVRLSAGFARCVAVLYILIVQRYGTMPNDTERYGTMPNDTERYGTIPNGTERYGTERYGTVQNGTVRYKPNDAEGYGTVQYQTIQNGTVRYNTKRYRTVRYGTIPNATERYGTKRHSTVRYGSSQMSVRYGTVQFGTVRFSTVRCGTVQYGTVRFSTVQFGTAQQYGARGGETNGESHRAGGALGGVLDFCCWCMFCRHPHTAACFGHAFDRTHQVTCFGCLFEALKLFRVCVRLGLGFGLFSNNELAFPPPFPPPAAVLPFSVPVAHRQSFMLGVWRRQRRGGNRGCRY